MCVDGYQIRFAENGKGPLFQVEWPEKFNQLVLGFLES